MKWKSSYTLGNVAHTESMQNIIRLGATLRSLLNTKRISLSTVSRETGISYSTLHTWLDNTQPRDILKVKILADYFGVTLHELLFGEAEEKSTIKKMLQLPGMESLIGTFEVTVRRRPDHESDEIIKSGPGPDRASHFERGEKSQTESEIKNPVELTNQVNPIE